MLLEESSKKEEVLKPFEGEGITLKWTMMTIMVYFSLNPEEHPDLR